MAVRYALQVCCSAQKNSLNNGLMWSAAFSASRDLNANKFKFSSGKLYLLPL